MNRHIIYPIFLPHAGCPYQCIYCDQNSVTFTFGEKLQPAGLIEHFELKFDLLVQQARERNRPGEVAFYGGTFTAIPIEVMRHILDAVSPWVERGVFSGIRFSTRPDCLGREVCSVLARYPVQTVELGVQSLCDEVLQEGRRGYSSVEAAEAIKRIREGKWRLGIQLMPGLPGDNRWKFLDSIQRTIGLRPDFVRLYPTLVLNGTALADWYREGKYQPLSLQQAVEWCAAAYAMFVGAEIPVIRMGLHADPELEKPGTILAGPHHPAFGHLVKAHWWRVEVDQWVGDRRGEVLGKRLILKVPQRFVSEVRGPRQMNVNHWLNRWRLDEVAIEGEPGMHFSRFEAALR